MANTNILSFFLGRDCLRSNLCHGVSLFLALIKTNIWRTSIDRLVYLSLWLDLIHRLPCSMLSKASPVQFRRPGVFAGSRNPELNNATTTMWPGFCDLTCFLVDRGPFHIEAVRGRPDVMRSALMASTAIVLATALEGQGSKQNTEDGSAQASHDV
jgi:hypothetical protein